MIKHFAAQPWHKSKKYPTKAAWLQGEFKWTLPVKWVGIDGFVTLDAERRAKITLSDANYHDHYDKLDVVIINKHQGIVDSKRFKFNDYMSAVPRPDLTSDDTLWCYDRDGGASWYIAVPDSTEPLVTAVEEYIRMFE
jgi:hypothetical protein